MAIVFPSPQRKQRMVLRIVIALLIFTLFVIPFIIFFPGFVNKYQIPLKELSKPKIEINFNNIDSDQVKNLEPFGDNILIEFYFIAENKNSEQINGRISAFTKNDAQKFLEEKGFKVLRLEQTNIGRKEPFTPYY